MTDTNVFENKTAAYYTLGCKLNFAETSTVGKELLTLGIRKVRPGEKADFCIINTCSVTELADKKCRQMIRKINKMHPSAYIIVTGCYAQLKPEEAANIEGVDLVLGSQQKSGITQYIRRLIDEKEPSSENIIISPTKDIRTFVPSCSAGDRTRHFLKVQDGCDYFCTYCTIPFARGRSRNGTIADIVKQAEKVAKEGGKEIVLTGVNIGDFGKSTGDKFIDLIRELDLIDDIPRFRISSIEPDLITDEIISFVAESRHFMPHFHIPLQSGSNAVLKLMRRNYDNLLFRKKTEQISKLIPDAFIGIDVIVGARGETEEFFEESKTFLESIPFSQLHVFSYSERPNTQALKITPVVSHNTKRERSKQFLDLSEKRMCHFYESHIGKTGIALFEHTKKGAFMHGFTENYIKTEIAYRKELCNTICPVRMTGWNENKTALTAEIADGG
ncbi:MAG: tRNA (N(6)-L-threonylcarbamoyladenosine(37)-C(2))-methylthiotransferase MtaB [Tannerella sp.]|jgi:threonylcarbamoyladenosine tRNA methylthiotransferase MtaB|nr:tRNA (N(6)-L-threonylcarbamoyladenosine(37)-C(2))-methylthiotransferase MtaB [Tannerella sp.]